MGDCMLRLCRFAGGDPFLSFLCCCCSTATYLEENKCKELVLKESVEKWTLHFLNLFNCFIWQILLLHIMQLKLRLQAK